MGWFWADRNSSRTTDRSQSETNSWAHKWGPSFWASSNNTIGSATFDDRKAQCPMRREEAKSQSIQSRLSDLSTKVDRINDENKVSQCPANYDKLQSARSGLSAALNKGPEVKDEKIPPPHSDEIDPRNNMFRDISQQRASYQTQDLDTGRTVSSIPRTDLAEKNWEYPSAQQMYNALLRKGYKDKPEEIPSMLEVHNWINERAWEEIRQWERDAGNNDPSLSRFEGKPRTISPKARYFLFLAKLFPDKYNGQAPFDRHDWYVQRGDKEIRYIIDYYSGPPLSTGEPVFYLDARPALDSLGAILQRTKHWRASKWGSEG